MNLLFIDYVGEHLLPGQIGQASIVLSFTASLLAAVAYFFATQYRTTENFTGWRNIGRTAFGLHALAIFSVIGVLFYIMIERYYEYQYVWAHVSDELPFQYIFSAFWEGQEGSFLLWMFWHIILGLVIMSKAGKWESPVLSILSLVQVFITSMILGVYLGFGENIFKLGSSPMLLLRDTMDAPIFANVEYLSKIKGNGLNPLLQNYWMTIHPPTLFLGFASTTIPFCYAIAGLWTNEHKAWLQPALPWALFNGAILGIGILMGGAWAYEALSFGGYWAWDPVENMSLVPWLLMIAGIHTHLVARATGYSIKSTYFFYISSFLLVLYSTFLTRSGVLGDTSVHAFTEMGLENQLILLISTFALIGFIPLAIKVKDIPAPKKEEAISSKEFWMFIGALVLLFSSIIITGSTSLPVFNKIMKYFNPAFEGRVITDVVEHYNKYQLWIAVFMALLAGVAQYLRYRERNFAQVAKKFKIHLLASIVLALGLTYLSSLWINMEAWQYLLLAFTGMFVIVTNLDYLISFTKVNTAAAASTLAHVGFGVMLIGILASGLNKRHISSNRFAMQGILDEERIGKNIMLIKNTPLMMNGYEVTYVRDTMEGVNRTYDINYKRRDDNGKILEDFNLQPNILYEKTFTKIAASNPSTKRYLTKDIFTHIASLPLQEQNFEYAQELEDSLNYRLQEGIIGKPFIVTDTTDLGDLDTFTIRKYEITIDGIDRNPSHPSYVAEEGDLAVGLQLSLRNLSDTKDTVYHANPMIALRGQLFYSYPIQINSLSTKVRVPDLLLERIFTPEEMLDYDSFLFKKDQVINYNGMTIRFAGFNKNPEHPNYQRKEGDIAVSGIFEVTKNDQSYRAEPVYLIRGNRPFNLKEVIQPLGLHFRFVNINPNTEELSILIAEDETKNVNTPVPLEVATDSLRSDYIVLEAIEFPGINLFWLGSSMMMIGLFVGMFRKRS